MAPVHVPDRHHVDPRIEPVELPGLLFQLGADLLVGADVAPAGRSDLDEHQVAGLVRVILEEPRESGELFRQPLRIVEPVDPDHRHAVAGAGQHALLGLPRGPARAVLDEVLVIDADGICAGAERPPLVGHPALFLVDFRTEFAAAVVVEALQPLGALEPDDIVGEQRADQTLVIGEHGQQAARRPGDVEEEPDAVPEAGLAQPVAQRHEMVVVHPDLVVLADQRGSGIGEELVHPLVAHGIVPVVLGQIQPVVKQRPQRRIGVAVIILLDVIGREVDRRSGDAASGFDGRPGFGRLGFAARPSDPQPVPLRQHCLQRPGQPALRSARPQVGPGHPVRNDHQPAHRTVLQLRDNIDAQLMIPTSE